MTRVLTFVAALLLALPALAHPANAVDVLPICQIAGDTVGCNSTDSEGALGSGEIPLGEKSGNKVSAHCEMHFAIFAVSNVSPITHEAQEYDASFKALVLFDIGYVVPRPPDAHA